MTDEFPAGEKNRTLLRRARVETGCVMSSTSTWPAQTLKGSSADFVKSACAVPPDAQAGEIYSFNEMVRDGGPGERLLRIPDHTHRLGDEGPHFGMDRTLKYQPPHFSFRPGAGIVTGTQIIPAFEPTPNLVTLQTR